MFCGFRAGGLPQATSNARFVPCNVDVHCIDSLAVNTELLKRVSIVQQFKIPQRTACIAFCLYLSPFLASSLVVFPVLLSPRLQYSPLVPSLCLCVENENSNGLMVKRVMMKRMMMMVMMMMMMMWNMFASDAMPSVRFVGRGQVLVLHRCPNDRALWQGLFQAGGDGSSNNSSYRSSRPLVCSSCSSSTF